MATIQYGVGNTLELPVTHTSEIGESHRQILGVPSNAVLVVNGQEGFEGSLASDTVVTFVTRSNSKA